MRNGPKGASEMKSGIDQADAGGLSHDPDPPKGWSTALLASLGYMALLLVLLLIPDNGTSGKLLHWFPSQLENLFHIPAFGLLALLWSRTFRIRKRGAGWTFRVVFAIAAGYGMLTELLQAGVPGRTASAMDFGLDLTGAILGLFFHFLKTRIPIHDSGRPKTDFHLPVMKRAGAGTTLRIGAIKPLPGERKGDEE
jgi:VanZ family protein